MERTQGFHLLSQQLKTDVVSISNTELQASLNLKIYFVLSGELELIHNGKGIRLKQGDIYLVNFRDLFGFITDDRNSVLVTTFDIEKTFFLNKPMSPIYMKEAYDKISHTLAAIFLEKRTQQSGHESIVEGYIYRLMGLLKRYVATRDKEYSVKDSSVLSEKTREIIEYMNQHYKKEITLDSLSQLFFISKYYLAHSFKEQMGLTIGNYLKEIRLIHSLVLVEKTELSIIDIASELGFSNVRSFSEGFSQKYGSSPKVYRQNLNNYNQNEEKETNLEELDALKILNEYAGIDGIVQLTKKQVKDVFTEICPNHLQQKMPDKNIFIRLQEVSSIEKIDRIAELKMTKYVSVTNIFEYIDLKLINKEWHIDTRRLLDIFLLVEEKNLIPYIQISFIDYEELIHKTNEEKLFYRIFEKIALDIEREFPFNKHWKIEFRCFYELRYSGKLCLQVKQIIPRFQRIGKSLIHLPVHPNLVEVPEKDGTILVIDDLARIKNYSFNAVYSLLTEPKYIDIISENKNIEFQSDIVKRMTQLEEDHYYGDFTDLVYANQMLWLFLHGINQNTVTFEPMSLDGTPLFTYFPTEISEKLSILSENNIRRDMWYAYQFRGKLFENIVFNNEFCIITKKDDNYRLLAIYPEKEVIDSLFKQESKSKQEATMKLKIRFSALNGNYQIIEQKITPEIKSKSVNVETNIKSKILPRELQAYFDEINQPHLSYKELEVKGKLDILIKLPIFGIYYIELNRIE